VACIHLHPHAIFFIGFFLSFFLGMARALALTYTAGSCLLSPHWPWPSDLVSTRIKQLPRCVRRPGATYVVLYYCVLSGSPAGVARGREGSSSSRGGKGRKGNTPSQGLRQCGAESEDGPKMGHLSSRLPMADPPHQFSDMSCR
jgi:hypothetical protein